MRPMKLTDLDVTLVLGVDSGTLPFLKQSVRTWRKFRPELFEVPWIVFHDGMRDASLKHIENRRSKVDPTTSQMLDLSFCADGKNPQIVHWVGDDDEYETQRERMLTGHVFVPAQHVHTDWTLKIDVDAICLSDEPWLEDKWFERDGGCYNSYVASSWSYTKAKGGGGTILDWARKLEFWGDGFDGFARNPRLDLEKYIDGKRINMHRMASWICFQRTQTLQDLADNLEGYKLPVPSHDTTLWYWCERRKFEFPHTERRMFKRRGWTNVPSFEKLVSKVEELV